MSKRINIMLPEKTVSVLDRANAKGSRSRFIDRAVLHYIETRGQQSLREQLKAGYRAKAERDPAIAAEWFPLEEEAARMRSEKPGRAKRTWAFPEEATYIWSSLIPRAATRSERLGRPLSSRTTSATGTAQ